MSVSLAGRRLTIADIRVRRPVDIEPEPMPPRPGPPIRDPGSSMRGAAYLKGPKPAPKPPAKQAKAPKTPAEKRKRPSRKRYQKRRRAKLFASVPPDKVQSLISSLAERYPVFAAWPRLPLATGVHRTILAEMGCDPLVLAVTMRHWCRHHNYLRALAAKDAKRYSLDGRPVGVVEVKDRDAARASLAAQKDKWKARTATSTSVLHGAKAAAA